MDVLGRRQPCHRAQRRWTTKKHWDSAGRSSCLEIQLKSWVLDWDARVFRRRISTPTKLSCYFTQDQYHLINTLVVKYHAKYPEQLGQDRFIWLTFATAIVKEHKKLRSSLFGRVQCVGHKCSLNRCMYILLWIGFYLKMDKTRLISEMLQEVITCTGNLRFLFSFLPGMGIKLYTLLLWNNGSQFEDELCKEYFNLISNNQHILTFQSRDLFDFSLPFLKFLLNRLGTFHSHHGELAGTDSTLVEILSEPILPLQKYSLLTLGCQFNDEYLVSKLLRLGVSPQHLYWDHITKNMITAEKVVVTLVNSVMVSQRILSHATTADGRKFSDAMLSKIKIYAPMMRRAVVQSQMRKANNFWSGEDDGEMFEVNREIADEWEIGYKPAFPSLVHLCRVRIRECIVEMDRECLPTALQTLPIPEKVVAYLDLQM